MYSQNISQDNRGAVVIVVDCSLSMKSITKFNHTLLPKHRVAKLITNHIIEELVARSARPTYMRDYFDIAVIGYSGLDSFSLHEELGDGFVSVVRFAECRPQPETVMINQLTREGNIVEVPITIHPWIETSAAGASPMYDALMRAKMLIGTWCKHRDNTENFPPIIFHITDGACSDAIPADLMELSREIQKIGTNDGNALIITIHLSTYGDEEEKCGIYPREGDFASADQDRMLMFQMSSIVPETLEPYVFRTRNAQYLGPYRAVALDFSPCSMLSIINIGSKTVSL